MPVLLPLCDLTIHFLQSWFVDDLASMCLLNISIATLIVWEINRMNAHEAGDMKYD